MTHDDPFIVHMNIARFQTLLRTDLDESTRRTVLRILSDYQVVAARLNLAVPSF